MAEITIPLPDPDTPSLTQTVQLSGRSYVMSFKWNMRTDRWTFGLETQDGTPVIAGSLLQCSGVGMLRTVPRSLDYAPPGELYCAGENDPTLDTINNVSLLYITTE